MTLPHLFADEGLALEAKGKGHVVGNAAAYTKLSALGLKATARGFEKRRLTNHRPPRRALVAASRTRPGRSIFAMDGVDFARALARMGLAGKDAVRDAVTEAQGLRAARIARLPLVAQLLADLHKVFASTTAHTRPRRPKPKPRRRPKPSTLPTRSR